MIFDEGLEWEDEASDTDQHPESDDIEDMEALKAALACGGRRAARIRLKPAQALKLVPSRLISRVWGKMNSIPIPKQARSTIYRSYSWAFGVNLDEVRYGCLLFRINRLVSA